MTAAAIEPVESPDQNDPSSIDEYSLPWTEEKWLALGETKPRVELFDGSLLVNAAPAPQHQDVSYRLANTLTPAARAVGLTVYQAINLRLRPGRIPIPDLAILTRINTREPIVDASACRLVCEIVSPSNSAVDRVLKMHYYAEAGIPWYLLVDPEPELTLRLYRLDGPRYAEHATGRPGEPLKLTEPIHVTIDPAAFDGD